MQADVYLRCIWAIFEAARSELIRASVVLGSNLPIIDDARKVNSFDHRTLQDAHDILAATFRYLHDDGGQFRILEDVESQQERYLSAWIDWLYKQFEEIVTYRKFAMSIVECVVYANTELGYLAENRSCGILLNRFDAIDWMYPSGYLKVYQSE